MSSRGACVNINRRDRRHVQTVHLSLPEGQGGYWSGGNASACYFTSMRKCYGDTHDPEFDCLCAAQHRQDTIEISNRVAGAAEQVVLPNKLYVKINKLPLT